jgi:hypothetical protein
MVRRWLRAQLVPMHLTSGRGITSYVAVVVHLFLAFSYQVPSLSIAPTSTVIPPGGVSIINYIDANGPYWVIGFTAAGLSLLVALWTRRALHLAHAVAAVVTCMYTVASFLGAFLSEPNRPIIVGLFGALAFSAHAGLSVAYSEQVVKHE